MPNRAPGASRPAMMSRSTRFAARSLNVSVAGTSVESVCANVDISASRLVQDEFIEIELGLQHFLRGHDVDPPAELFGLQARLGPVRYRCLHEFDRLLGEFRDRSPGLVPVGIDDISAFRDRGAEFL